MKEPKLYPQRFTPINDMVVIQEIKPPNMTADGLILPDNQRELWETPIGLVVAIGPNVKQAKRGDLVVVPNGQLVVRFRIGREVTWAMLERSIGGVFDEPDEVRYARLRRSESDEPFDYEGPRTANGNEPLSQFGV